MESTDPEKDVWRKQWNEGKERQRWILQNGYGSRRQKTYTENGAAARNTTGDARLDLFATIGSLRRADPERIELLFAEAYQADPLFALKILFYARDIREGLGERRVFRILLQYLAEYHPQAVIANLDLIGVFGRFDDWYCLIGTGVEDEMWSAMKQQLEADLKNFQEGKSVSLLAKWIKTADSKNTETRKLGILTAQKLGYPVYNFKRIVRSLRKYIGVLEVKMSERKWGDRLPGGLRKSHDDLQERISKT